MAGYQEMTRKQHPRGMSFCSKGRHLAPVAEFYVREGGKLSSWCKACTMTGAKQSKEMKHMVAVLVEKMVEREEEPKDIEEQTIIHTHVTKYGPTPEVLAWPPTTLDWLTPIWGFQERSKMEQ